MGLAQCVLRVQQGEPVGVELILEGLLLGQALRSQFLHQDGFRLCPVQDTGQLLILFFLLYDGFLIGFELAIHGLDLMLAFAAKSERAKLGHRNINVYGGTLLRGSSQSGEKEIRKPTLLIVVESFFL